MKDVLVVEEPRGDRWDLAVDLLTSGDGFISFGNSLLYRSTAGPAPDHRVRASLNPEQLTAARCAADVEMGRARLDEIRRDERFAELSSLHGVTCDYVYDYETGRVALATVDHDGVISWAPGFAPRPS
jgi:hypothetical protein